MPPAKFKTKPPRRDERAEALARLRERWQKDHEDEAWEAENEPVVTPMLRGVEGGIKRVLEALRAYDDADAQAFLEVYDACTATDRRLLRLEDVAFASGIGSLRLAEVAQTALFLYADTQTKLLISSAMHKVTKSIIKAATDEVPIVVDTVEGRKQVGKTNGDIKAMELFGKISGQVPLPKNTVNNYTQNNFGEREERKQLSEPSHVWKYPEDRLKEIASVVNPRQLPSHASKNEDLIHFEQNRPMVFER
ncbi:MAG: hypothetical protein ACYCOU_00050 [Sulfobacillus sp.]